MLDALSATAFSTASSSKLGCFQPADLGSVSWPITRTPESGLFQRSTDHCWMAHGLAGLAVSHAPAVTDSCLALFTNPITALGTEQGRGQRDTRLAVQQRLGDLKIEAMREQLRVSDKSEQDLLRFLRNHPDIRRPYLYLLDNGNFRVVWKNTGGEQIGLQFRGDGEIQFVIFAKRPDAKNRATTYGRDSFLGIERQIDAHDLRKLLRA
jgi:hypothetical protein